MTKHTARPSSSLWTSSSIYTTNWYCILGGVQQLADKMEDKVAHKPAFNSFVTAIRSMAAMKVEVDMAKSLDGQTKTT